MRLKRLLILWAHRLLFESTYVWFPARTWVRGSQLSVWRVPQNPLLLLVATCVNMIHKAQAVMYAYMQTRKKLWQTEVLCLIHNDTEMTILFNYWFFSIYFLRQSFALWFRLLHDIAQLWDHLSRGLFFFFPMDHSCVSFCLLIQGNATLASCFQGTGMSSILDLHL